jgi:flavorubredoxin
MKSKIIFESETHKWIAFGRDSLKKDSVIDTNQYLIISNGQGFMLDPGGIEIFPQVLTEVTKYIDTNNIKGILASHQDPDIASSLSLWVDLSDDLKIYCSWLWGGFLAHFSMGTNLEFITVPDEGMEVQIGSTRTSLYFVPAHYCHSSGNFSLYDPKADILFSGDIGAALLPNAEAGLFVDDFHEHIQYMEGFHKRWMPSKSALNSWVSRARAINPKMICPQHGSIFEGENVHKFLNWLEGLEVGLYDNSQEKSDIRQTPWMKWKR